MRLLLVALLLLVLVLLLLPPPPLHDQLGDLRRHHLLQPRLLAGRRSERLDPWTLATHYWAARPAAPVLHRWQRQRRRQRLPTLLSPRPFPLGRLPPESLAAFLRWAPFWGD